LDGYQKTYKIKESLGTYYQDDLTTAEDIGEIESPNINEVNKVEKRVITYTFTKNN